MKHQDYQGLAVSQANSETLDKINCFIQEMVSNGPNSLSIIELADTHPSLVLAQLYAGTLFLYGQTPKDTAKATTYLNKAHLCIEKANDREKILYQAIKALSTLDFFLAIKLFQEILQAYPQDLLSLKHLEWLFYLTGQANQAEPFLYLCESLLPHYPSHPHFYSTYSFALELSGQQAKAIDIAHQAITLERITPWAHHTLAHAYFFMKQFNKAIEELEQLQPTWKTVLPAIKSHNSWHLGLFYIAKGNTDKANQLLQQSIWGLTPGTVLEAIDTISYIWRMEMSGLPASLSFEEILPHIRTYATIPYIPFNSLFFLYAALRTNDEALAKDIFKRAHNHHQTLSGEHALIWQTVGLPTLYGVHAFVKEDYPLALYYLSPIQEHFTKLGGSDAQIEILQEVYCLSLIKAKQQNKALKYFTKRLPFYIYTLTLMHIGFNL